MTFVYVFGKYCNPPKNIQTKAYIHSSSKKTKTKKHIYNIHNVLFIYLFSKNEFAPQIWKKNSITIPYSKITLYFKLQDSEIRL